MKRIHKMVYWNITENFVQFNIWKHDICCKGIKVQEERKKRKLLTYLIKNHSSDSKTYKIPIEIYKLTILTTLVVLKRYEK